MRGRLIVILFLFIQHSIKLAALFHWHTSHFSRYWTKKAQTFWIIATEFDA